MRANLGERVLKGFDICGPACYAEVFVAKRGSKRLRVFVLVTVACLSACSWFAPRKTQVPDPTEIIVTGAPAGSTVFVDGLQTGQATAINDHPRVLDVAAGAHRVEIHVGDSVVYREDTYVEVGEHHIVRVLSGLNR